MSRWVKDHRIDQLKFARQKIAYGYFAAASVLYSPELSDARCSWAKNTVLVTLIDDFFDFAGSEEELLNLMELVEKYAFSKIRLFYFLPFSRQLKQYSNLKTGGRDTQI